jgi:hypothetical protein
VITSQVVVVPKKTPGKFTVIVDLCYQPGCSVNDAIPCEFMHIAYSSIDDVALLMHSLGKRYLMAEIDVKDAYRLVLVHPEDWRFLGVSWNDRVYVDC